MQSFIPQWLYKFLCGRSVVPAGGRRQLRLSMPVLLAVFLLLLLIRTVNAHGVSPVAPPLLPACYAADLRCSVPDPQHQSALFPSNATATAFTDTPPYDGKWLALMPGLVDAANHPVVTPQALFDVPCVAGFADAYPCNNVDLLAYLPPSAIGGQTNNDNWGWRDPVDGTEYALIGATDGVVFLDISTPTAPLYLGKLPSHGTISSWRDLKVYQDHAFVVADYNRNHGMQVFDLHQLRTVDRNAIPVVFQESAHYAGFADAHNVAINEASGYAYAVGTRTCDGGLHIVDIRDPRAPVEAGCYAADGYIHDTQCVTYHGPDTRYLGRELCFNASVSQVTIVDVTEKHAPVRLGTVRDKQSVYIHQGWLTADQRYFVMNDEMDELFGLQQSTSSYVIDVQRLDAPRLIGQYHSTLSSIDHNLYISDTYIYEANYTSGLRLLDGKDLAEGRLQEVASFDTFPEHDDPVFLGAWTAYPYFKDGTVVVSTLDRGVFILRPRLVADVLVESPAATALLCRADLANKPFTTTIALQPRNHYTQNATLALGNLPPLITATLAPAVIDLQAQRNATSTLTADLQLVADGLYTVTVAATSPAAAPLDRTTVALHIATTAATTPTVLAPTLPLTSSTLALTWQPLTTAAHYRIELAADAQFTQVLEQVETAATSHLLQTPLALNTRYFWRVTPLNGCGAGPAADGRLQTAVGLFLPLVMQ